MLLVSPVVIVFAARLFIGAVAPDEADGLMVIAKIIAGVIGVLILSGFYQPGHRVTAVRRLQVHRPEQWPARGGGLDPVWHLHGAADAGGDRLRPVC